MSITRRNVAIGFSVLGAGAGMYLAWPFVLPSGSIRYRITAEIEVDGRLSSGSSVGEIKYVSYRNIPHIGHTIVQYMRSQATVVPISDRGYLFVLIGNLSYPQNYTGPINFDMPHVISEAFGLDLSDRQIRSLDRLTRSVDLPRRLFPPMIKFGDLRVPTSAQYVYPENLEGSFGPGVRLHRLHLETSQAVITTGIQRLLPWLPRWRGFDYQQSQEVRRSVMPVPLINQAHFSQGLAL